MIRRGLPVILAALWVAALASPVAAAPGTPGHARDAVTADHIGGSVETCGRIVEFTAPIIGTDGSLTVAGIVDGLDHAFTIDEGASVSPQLAGLAAAGEWTCLSLTGDGMGVLVDVSVAGISSCGPLTLDAGTFVQQAGSSNAFTTITFDGDAGAFIAADTDLTALLESITLVAAIDWAPDAAEVCFDVALAGDGTFDSLLVDYAAAPGVALPAPVACGMVNGTPLPYRDPASQPFPDDPTVGVAGFFVDTTLLTGPHQDVLAFHLDAVAEVCLLAEVVDSVIVAAGVLSDPATEVCGELEVVGGLVFVDTVVVSQGLTGVNFGEPSPASIALACWSARAPTGGADGLLIICGDFDSATDTTFTVSDVTFHLTTDIDDSDLPPVGGPQAVALIGPDPFEPFGAGNPARVTTATLTGCAGAPPPVPDTATGWPGSTDAAALMALAAVAIMGGATALAVVRSRRR